ncbi:MAG TPA: hypothetical protein VM935_08510, partial [Chitinophagaceae bacterium]|nr:hypothetical protein [Chitinophagaceae bacterium]
MKATIISIMALCCSQFLGAQKDFKKELEDARASYAANKLDDSRFAMQQMLYELDMITGKEVLKLLPQKMGEHSVVTKADNVAGASGFVGVIIHREWGKDKSSDKNVSMDIISNSPLIASLNALLAIPFVAGAGDNKVVRVGGYKGLVSKTEGGGTTNYDFQLPLNNALITLKSPGLSQDEVIKLANS